MLIMKHFVNLMTEGPLIYYNIQNAQKKAWHKLALTLFKHLLNV